ncbi:MAG: hypothetical protein M1387_10565 [Thaumarchaeota archaeon]|nr:hypothetical protein [Nitrososphaerota archaeon]
MENDISSKVLDRLSEIIQDAKLGLDPNIIGNWYKIIEAEAKEACPEKLRDSIQVVQDPVLPMKFQLKSSRRAVKHVIEAINRNLPDMPMATRLYFQKLEEIIDEEAASQDFSSQPSIY